MTENEVGQETIASAMTVHSALGPGLLEGVYELCLAHELTKRGLPVQRQVSIPISYQDLTIDNGYRIDLLVSERVVVELKALEGYSPGASQPTFELSSPW